MAAWLVSFVRWLLAKKPPDFVFVRTSWSGALLTMLLWEQEQIRVSPETVRRGLAGQAFVGRRPRTVVGPTDPDYDQKLWRPRRFIA